MNAVDNITGTSKILRASSSANTTWSSQLAELNTAFDALTAQQKAESYILDSTGNVYSCISNTGLYMRVYVGTSATTCTRLQIATSKRIDNSNGATFSSADNSSAVFTGNISLYA